jgi:acyl-CoA reductase-like NAD-dependent aldehyde dehydrogenase
MFINVEWMSGVVQTVVINPYGGKKIESIPMTSDKWVNETIEAADRAV